MMAPITPVMTITRIHTSLVLLEHGIVRYLDYIDDRPDPESERSEPDDEHDGEGGCV